MWNSLLKPAFILVLVCIVISGSLALVNGMTKDLIALRIKTEQEESRQKVMEKADHFVEVTHENVPDTVKRVYAAYIGEELAGYVMDVTTKGYGGNIGLVIGINKEGRVTGVVIGENKETPGLGTKMHEPSFIQQFQNVGTKDNLSVVKQNKKSDSEIQALSGATITSRAVTDGVRAALDMAKTLLEGGS